MKPIRLEDDGYAPVELTVNGELHTRSIDLLATQDRLIELSNENEDKPTAEFWEADRQYWQSLGFPPLSATVLSRLRSAVYEGVADLAKKHAPVGPETPNSPGSTGSPSAA